MHFVECILAMFDDAVQFGLVSLRVVVIRNISYSLNTARVELFQSSL